MRFRNKIATEMGVGMHPFAHKTMIQLAVPLRLKIMRQIQRRAGWGSAKIRAFQEEALRRMIAYSWNSLPYYREKWKPYISGPESIRRIEDLQQLPILTKDEFRENREHLQSIAPGLKCREGRTGGSTGRPVLYQMCPEDEETAWAQMYTGWHWAGFQLGRPFLVIGGESIGIGIDDRRTWQDFVMNRWVTSGSNITLGRVKHLVSNDIFRDIHFIYGYPNSIREFGEHLRTLDAKFPQLVAIVCTAEVMTDEVRARIHACYGEDIRVLDQWGMFDGSLQGCESVEREGLHVHFHSGLLEIVDEDNRQITEMKRVGRGLGTSLVNRCTPFVRYETGDMVHWYSREPSSSGVGWPRIGPVDGRQGDVIYLPSGRSIPMPGLTLVMRWLDGLYQYQFIQTTATAVTARLMPRRDFVLSESEILALLRERISDEIDWTIEFGPPQLTANGKLLIIRNDWLRQKQIGKLSHRASSEGPETSR
jgi:phenylacetate-CoA ligase